MENSEIAGKLAEISDRMGDAVFFVHMRFFLEDMEQKASQGDVDAGTIVSFAENFHKLCAYVEKNQKRA